MKHIIIILGLLLLASACNTEEVYTYIGTDYVQFRDSKTLNYSFVYAGSTVKRDTVWLEAFCTGDTYKTDRSYTLRQVPQYTFSYRYDETGGIIDSVLVTKDNQAEPGVHYVPFDDPAYEKLFVVPADSVTFRVPVILLRDYTLKENIKSLLVQFVGDGNFVTGDPYTLKKIIQVSDILVYPEAWSDYVLGGGIAGTNPIFGRYGKVKHQLMIDVTGKPWDNEFFDSLTYEDKLMYKNMVAKELFRINQQRAEQGELPLMEDPDNPNSIVVFP